MTKFGLIPEFIGRVPVMVSLELLTEEALVRILTEPKNALIKQYQKLFELDDVKLEFTEEASGGDCAAGSGAKDRRQRTALYHGIVMMDLMYEIPSDQHIGICTITRGCGEKDRRAGDRIPGCDGAQKDRWPERLREDKTGEIA